MIVLPFLLKKYSFQTDRLSKVDEPVLMLANHTTEADFLMATYAAGKPMRFVCGEHLLRGRFGKLLKWFVNPIALPKGASSISAVREIMRRLRRGENVLLFPEGCRSFNGETVPLQTSLGKMVKQSGAMLVTYHLQGGYFVAPRWAYHFRKGPMEGHILHICSSDELRRMSAEEITALINRDLYENAYETQKINPQRYIGEGLAEGLENYLLICPSCGSYDSLQTKGSRFSCTCCGLTGEYDEYGFLNGDNLPFKTVYDWGKWIVRRFDEDAAAQDESALMFTEKDIRLYRISAAKHYSQDCMVGSLRVYRDRLEIGEYHFPFANISDMAMLYYGKSLLFTCEKEYYGMTGPAFHAWKADRLYRLYKKGTPRKAG